MSKIFPPKKIYISESKSPDPKNNQFVSGRGVFAGENIRKGEIIEVAPILILEFTDFIDTKWNLLFEYFFWMDDFVALSLGYGSLYNHSINPNIEYRISKKEKTISFTAVRDIKKDEEILFNYKGSSNPKTPLWFERKK